MAIRGSYDGQSRSASYSDEQVAAVLEELEIEIDGDYGEDFLCLCPIHGNFNTPSFSISKETGLFFCHNPSCNETGTLVDLCVKVKGMTHFEAARLIKKHEGDPADFQARLRKKMATEFEWNTFSQETLDKLSRDFWNYGFAVDYMYGRGFGDEVLRHFEIGYSLQRDLIAVPMHNPAGVPIGIIGRSLVEHAFKNSWKLQKTKTLFNFHRAKEYDTVILNEASFDTMSIHQAGYPYAAACLGGHMSAYHFDQVQKYFKTIIIMTDWDLEKQFSPTCRRCKREGLNLCKGHRPGRDLGRKIAGGLTDKTVLWAGMGDGIVYPPGCKDATDMNTEQIGTAIENAIPSWKYEETVVE